MDVILSIRPVYISEMVKGIKKYEYRKRIFKEKVEKIYIYSTSPIKKIIGYVEYNGYLEGSPKEIWELTKNESGICKEKYFEYFANANLAYAIDFKKIFFLDEPLNPKEIDKNFIAPQSYRYVKDDISL